MRYSYSFIFIHLKKHMDGARSTSWKEYCLRLKMNAFGPKKFWFSCMGKKVPFWQFFRNFKNCQNGTLLPMNENQNFFGPNDYIWSAKKVLFRDFIQKMSQTPSMCLRKWIKVDRWDHLKNHLHEFFLFRVVPMNLSKEWDAKMERAHFFNV